MNWKETEKVSQDQGIQKTLTKLHWDKVLLSDVADMLAARERSKIIHATADIDTAGDEVEESVRRVLRRKLPLAYYTGQGHIVDYTWCTSPQIDIILADNFSMPVLFKAEDGTEYFPYESVYGVGEVKSTYYKNKNPIESFVARCKAVRSLKRKKTGDPGVDCVNPLLTFMLFIDSGDFSIDDVKQLYSKTLTPELPNLICFLDKGLIFYGAFALNDLGHKVLVHYITDPELSKPKAGRFAHWTFIPFGNDSSKRGANWGNLYCMILDHLRGCRLAVPSMATYFLGAQEWEEGVIIAPE